MSDDALSRLRQICLALPETKETLTWGEPHFRVGEKIFCGFGKEKGGLGKGRWAIGFKLEKMHAAALIATDSRCWRAPYVGRHGWVSLDAEQVEDWNELRELILESYRLIAPRRVLAKLHEEEA